MNKRPLLIRSTSAPFGRIEYLDISPDGSRIISGDNNVTIHFYDARSGKVLHSYTFGPGADGEDVFTKAKFSPDGHLVAALAANAQEEPDPRWPLVVLSAETLEPVTPLPTGARMATFASKAWPSARTAGTLLRARTESPISPTPSALSGICKHLVDRRARSRLTTGSESVALSPDGRTIYGQRPLTAYDVVTGRRLWQRPGSVGGPFFDTGIGPPSQL